MSISNFKPPSSKTCVKSVQAFPRVKESIALRSFPCLHGPAYENMVVQHLCLDAERSLEVIFG